MTDRQFLEKVILCDRPNHTINWGVRYSPALKIAKKSGSYFDLGQEHEYSLYLYDDGTVDMIQGNWNAFDLAEDRHMEGDVKYLTQTEFEKIAKKTIFVIDHMELSAQDVVSGWKFKSDEEISKLN